MGPRSTGQLCRCLPPPGRGGIIEQALAERLARAAGFRNVVAHAYDELDMRRVFRAASGDPRDLERFLAVLAARLEMAGGIDGPSAAPVE